MKKNHVKIGDRVKIITGDKKGILGNILSINKKKSAAIIDSITPRLKKIKKIEGKESQDRKLPIAIQLSNLMLWDNEASQCSRIVYKLINKEKKRYFKKSGNII